jgi:hypothetical protein
VTLTEFLLARIAEDKAVAQAAYDDLNYDGDGTRWTTSSGYEHNILSGVLAVFERSMSPERVLAECESKRRIITLGICLACEVEYQPCDHKERTLRLLAMPYADHPDFQPEWRIE